MLYNAAEHLLLKEIFVSNSLAAVDTHTGGRRSVKMYTISGKMGRMDFDAILNHIGQCGKWQWRNFFLLWLTREENHLNTFHVTRDCTNILPC